jgi:hypothetical protein
MIVDLVDPTFFFLCWQLWPIEESLIIDFSISYNFILQLNKNVHNQYVFS